MAKSSTGKTKESNETLEQKLWKSADKLRKNMDAAEYKHVVLGLIFLKYISDSFEQLHQKLLNGDEQYAGADPEDKDEYLAENVFFVPEKARWSYLQAQAKQPEIGKYVDEAMIAIEQENPGLRGVLSKVYAKQNLDKTSLGGLIDLIGSFKLVRDKKSSAEQLELDLEQNTKKLQQADVLGRVYEYFLGQFALEEGKKGGQFYTPEPIVKLLVEMLEPYNGRVFDPCCGSGGMFVQSEKFVANHQGRLDDISIYGQESNETTYRLCKMNLAIRGIDSSNIKWNNEGSFLNDAHTNLKADFIIANPPFNDSDWGGEHLRNDGRWKYGTPPAGNANFAWVQHFLYHLAPTGSAGFVLSNGSLSSNTGGEGEIRQKLVEDDLVDCIVMLPTQLFYNTGIPACLWFLSRYKNGNKNRSRKGEVLFIDASELGEMINRRNRTFTDSDIDKIANTYHEWKKKNGNYHDIKGFCKSATLEEIEKHKFVLTPGRYVGIPDEEEDDITFEERMIYINTSLKEITEISRELDAQIKTQLNSINISLKWDNIEFSSSEILEYIAQTLFKHWFIDFEFPNDDGKPYKSAGGAMVASELGDIPEGWRAGKLGEEVETVGGGTPSTTEPSYWDNGDIYWYSPTDLTKSKTIFSLDTAKKITKLGLDKSSAKLFPKYSILMTSRATIGEITINTNEACTNQGFITLIPNNFFDTFYLFCWLKTQLAKVNLLASGSTFPELSKSDFRKFDFIIPSKHILLEFRNLVTPIFLRIESNTKQIQILGKRGDILLPKFINDQIRV